MSKQKEMTRTAGELVALQPITEVTVLPPNSGVVGRFLEEVQNMFRARAMRMGGLLRRINESGQRTELILRMGAERMEAAEARLEQDLRKQGLIVETEQNNGTEE
ncbi:MAG: hypothetical protein ACLQPD_25700 [Desulfomonilaceae bacterium]